MSYEAESGLVRLRRTWLFLATTVWMIAGLVPVVIGVLGAGIIMPIWASVLVITGYLVGVAGGASAWSRWWAQRRGKVLANEDGLWVDGRLIVARNVLDHAYPIEHEGRHAVRLVRRGTLVRSIDVNVASPEEGRALLRAMRLDGASSVTQWRLFHDNNRSRRSRIGVALAAFLVTMSVAITLMVAPSFHTMVALRLVGLALYVLGSAGFGFALQSLAVTVAVGADGVRLKGLTSKRFLPFGDIERVGLDGGHITLHLKSGATVAFHHPDEGKPNLLTDREHEAKSLAARIEEQLASHRSAPKHNVDVLTRAGRRAEEWLRDAQALTERNATFRTPAVPQEELWRIVEDAAAEPTARAGAALALRSELDDPSRARLRVAASACAAPQLRVALESVADEEDEADLLRALDPLKDLRIARS